MSEPANGFVELAPLKVTGLRVRGCEVLAECAEMLFESGTREYDYFVREHGTGWNGRDYGTQLPRFVVCENLVRRGTGALAVRVWLTDAQIERMNDALDEKLNAAHAIEIIDLWENEVNAMNAMNDVATAENELRKQRTEV